MVNHKYTALCEENRGIAVLNDCKYGVRTEEGTISLTLLRSPKVPDMSADMGVHHFTYAFDFWNEPFFDCDVVRKGYELNVPPMMIQGTGSRSFLQIDAPNVILDGIKFAEDDSGDIILRLYECKHASVSCRLTITLNGYSNAVETDMCEKEAKAVKVEGGIINLTFHPFEIKTIRLINTIQ